MAKRYLIDTSAAIKYLNTSLPPAGLDLMDSIANQECNISFISEIELLAWSPPNEADLVIYAAFVSASNVIGLSPDLISETIRIRKEFKLKLPDAIIAATALINNFILLADNDKDFGKIPSLNYINPRSTNG